MELSYLQAIILGIVEGLTEFLPVSSTGHLTIASGLLGLQVDAPAVTAYTAIIQLGAIAATFIYFASDIARMFTAWVAGLRGGPGARHPDYQLAWAVIIGSLPVGLVGFALRDVIEGPLRSLWVVAAGLILWSGVMWLAERRGDAIAARGRQRDEQHLRLVDGLIIGSVQCFSLIPGVSRSGATISAGLVAGLDRVTATRMSFFMAIPALTAAGLFQAAETAGELRSFGIGPILVGIVVAFVVAYASIAWLLRFVAHHAITWFVGYRVALGAAVMVALAAGWISAT